MLYTIKVYSGSEKIAEMKHLNEEEKTKHLHNIEELVSGEIDNVPENFVNSMWNNIDNYCEMFESPIKKVRTVISREEK